MERTGQASATGKSQVSIAVYVYHALALGGLGAAVEAEPIAAALPLHAVANRPSCKEASGDGTVAMSWAWVRARVRA